MKNVHCSTAILVPMYSNSFIFDSISFSIKAKYQGKKIHSIWMCNRNHFVQGYTFNYMTKHSSWLKVHNEHWERYQFIWKETVNAKMQQERSIYT